MKFGLFRKTSPLSGYQTASILPKTNSIPIIPLPADSSLPLRLGIGIPLIAAGLLVLAFDRLWTITPSFLQKHCAPTLLNLQQGRVWAPFLGMLDLRGHWGGWMFMLFHTVGMLWWCKLSGFSWTVSIPIPSCSLL